MLLISDLEKGNGFGVKEDVWLGRDSVILVAILEVQVGQDIYA